MNNKKERVTGIAILENEYHRNFLEISDYNRAAHVWRSLESLLPHYNILEKEFDGKNRERVAGRRS